MGLEEFISRKNKEAGIAQDEMLTAICRRINATKVAEKAGRILSNSRLESKPLGKVDDDPVYKILNKAWRLSCPQYNIALSIELINRAQGLQSRIGSRIMDKTTYMDILSSTPEKLVFAWSQELIRENPEIYARIKTVTNPNK